MICVFGCGNVDGLCAELQLVAGSGWIERDSQPRSVFSRECEVKFTPLKFYLAFGGSAWQRELLKGFATLYFSLSFCVEGDSFLAQFGKCGQKIHRQFVLAVYGENAGKGH